MSLVIVAQVFLFCIYIVDLLEDDVAESDHLVWIRPECGWSSVFGEVERIVVAGAFCRAISHHVVATGIAVIDKSSGIGVGMLHGGIDAVEHDIHIREDIY